MAVENEAGIVANESSANASRLEVAATSGAVRELAGQAGGPSSEARSPRDLRGHDFTGASLVGHDFSGANPAGACFRKADLSAAIFDDANLTGADFQDADLTRASLKRALLEGSGIEDVHLPGADLSGAKAGAAQAKLETRLETAKSLADTLRSVFIATSGLLAYIGATVISASDALVLTNQTTMDLPLVEAKVSVHAFFYISAILIVTLEAYILSRVSHFARVVSRLPARLPEGPPLREQVDPWVLSCVGILQRADLPLRGSLEVAVSVRTLFEWFGARMPGFIARWLAPGVLWLLLLRFFVACRPDQAAWRTNVEFAFLVIAFLSSWAITFGLRSYSELVEGTKPAARASHYALAAFALIALAMGLRFASGAWARYGAPGEVLAGAQLAGANLSNWNFAGSNFEKANLSSTNLSGARFQEARLVGADLRRTTISGISLISAVASGAQFALTRGERANFGQATLDHSNFRHAALSGAILQGATLTDSQLANFQAPLALAVKADFSGSVLDDAVFDHAQMNNARFTKNTTLFRARFEAVDLSSASFNSAQLFDAVFKDANLSYTSFSGAHISKVDMSGALLRRTLMDVAEAWSLNLDEARIEEVSMQREAGGTGQLNLASATFRGAHLSGVNAANANLSYANFENATLDGVDLSQANLTAVSFAGAAMKNVKMNGANLYASKLTAEQLRGIDVSGAQNLAQPLPEAP